MYILCGGLCRSTVSVTARWFGLVPCCPVLLSSTKRRLVKRFVVNLISKALNSNCGPIARGSHTFTCHPHEPYLPLLRKHSPDGATPAEVADIQLQLLLIYRLRKDERLSWPGWLTCSGWFTHISVHPSAASRAQDRECSPAKDRRSTAVPRNQVHVILNVHNTLMCINRTNK